MHKTRRAECPCSSVPPAGTPALPALLQSPELGAGSVQELPCAQALGHANLGLLLQVSPPQAEEVKPRVCLHRAAAWSPTPEPLPWLLQLQGHPRGLPGPGGHSHCSCNLELSWGCWVGQFRNTSASGAICNGCTASSRGTFPKELFHCSNLVSLHLQLGLPSSTREMQGLEPGGLWREENGKLSSGKSSTAAVSVTWQRDSVSSSHVGWVTQGLGNHSGIPAMSHGGNNGNIREQERIFHLVTSLGHQEQRESPRFH